MSYQLCGCHVFDLDFEDIIDTVDGFPCPHSPEDHLYVRQPGLVVPTTACTLVAHDRALLVWDGVSRPRGIPLGTPSGDYEITRWRERGPYLEVLVPSLGHEVAQAVA